MRRISTLLICLLVFVGCHGSAQLPPTPSVPIFAADGKSIVFSRVIGRECFLYRADLLTGETHRVTHSESGCETDPAFAPDGSLLAFIRANHKGERGALVVEATSGGSEKILVADTEDNLSPAFVPNSHSILFLRSGAFEHYSPIVGDRRHKFDLFDVNTDTGKVAQLTNEQYYEISHAAVSNDGKQVMLTVSTYPEGDHFIVMSIDDPKASRRSLQPVVPGAPKTPILYNAVWLPDGKGILFSAATEPVGGGNFNYNIYRQDLVSGRIDQLTDLKGIIDGFSLSPDGGRAAILQRGHYFLLDVTSRQLKQIGEKPE